MIILISVLSYYFICTVHQRSCCSKWGDMQVEIEGSSLPLCQKFGVYIKWFPNFFHITSCTAGFLLSHQHISHYKCLCRSQFFPKASQYPLPSGAGPVSLFPSSLPHIFFGSCHFKLVSSLQAYHRTKPKMPFHYLCNTDQSSFGALCLNFPELAFWVASGVSGTPGWGEAMSIFWCCLMMPKHGLNI